jgi:hypothetical protein
MWKLLPIAVVALPAASCADLNPTQQRALTGTAAGAGIGQSQGPSAATPDLDQRLAAGAGLLGGLVVDRQRQAEDRAFQPGVAAGRRGATTSTFQ